ncbi:MAG: riboflavin synthase [Saprospiraceae bacterium]|nr:riboflavin synthase [Saprospiraceae bacterium]
MFCGIVEAVGKVVDIEISGTNRIFTIEHPYSDPLYIDQSISHNGVCLTVVAISESTYKVEAILETLNRSNLGSLTVGDIVNLERSIQMSTRIDGHMVQGHVDNTAIVKSIEDLNGSWSIVIELDPNDTLYTIPKGSIAINGISLTIAQLNDTLLGVAIIPYTYHHTNLKFLQAGDRVNLEYDSIGKYVIQYMNKIKS